MAAGPEHQLIYTPSRRGLHAACRCGVRFRNPTRSSLDRYAFELRDTGKIWAMFGRHFARVRKDGERAPERPAQPVKCKRSDCRKPASEHWEDFCYRHWFEHRTKLAAEKRTVTSVVQGGLPGLGKRQLAS